MQFIFNIPVPAFFQRYVDRRRSMRIAKTSFTFKGWKDKALAEKYRGSLGFYEVEISGRRADIRLPGGILQFFVHGTRGPDDIGSKIDILYFPDRIAREQAKKFFDEAGLIVE